VPRNPAIAHTHSFQLREFFNPRLKSGRGRTRLSGARLLETTPINMVTSQGSGVGTSETIGSNFTEGLVLQPSRKRLNFACIPYYVTIFTQIQEETGAAINKWPYSV
jgi:hypothetical protein